MTTVNGTDVSGQLVPQSLLISLTLTLTQFQLCTSNITE